MEIKMKTVSEQVAVNSTNEPVAARQPTGCALRGTQTRMGQDVIDEALMLTTQDVARLLKCSEGHIKNLRKDNLMPQPVKLRDSVRWSRKQIEAWIDAGCPAICA